jgi:hypothetical protein
MVSSPQLDRLATALARIAAAAWHAQQTKLTGSDDASLARRDGVAHEPAGPVGVGQ